MELHLEDGTHRLELPVSRMTLKVWGGVPMLISEKSVAGGSVRWNGKYQCVETYTEHSGSSQWEQGGPSGC